jgi:hypothetical protein
MFLLTFYGPIRGNSPSRVSNLDGDKGYVIVPVPREFDCLVEMTVFARSIYAVQCPGDSRVDPDPLT